MPGCTSSTGRKNALSLCRLDIATMGGVENSAEWWSGLLHDPSHQYSNTPLTSSLRYSIAPEAEGAAWAIHDCAMHWIGA